MTASTFFVYTTERHRRAMSAFEIERRRAFVVGIQSIFDEKAYYYEQSGAHR